jgi:hypothetical protein
VTRRTWRWFRFTLFALLWLGAAAFQTYVSDVGTHGVAVGGYLPDSLLALASIPAWAFLIAVALNGIIALFVMRIADLLLRLLAILNAALLILYALIGVAVIFYIAFANNGIS